MLVQFGNNWIQKIPLTAKLDSVCGLVQFLKIFQRFPTTLRRFPKISKIVPKARRTFPNIYRTFPNFLRRLLKIAEDDRRRSEDFSIVNQQILV